MSPAGVAFVAIGGLVLAWCFWRPAPAQTRPPTRVPAPIAVQSSSVGCPTVRLLGPVTFEGIAEPVRGAKVGELIAYLATHPRGATDGELKAALWGDRPVAGGTFNNTVSLARRVLGPDGSGEPYLPAMSNGLYRLSGVTTDVEQILSAPIGEERGRLLAAIAGVPFAGVAWDWPMSDGLVDHAAVAMATAALETAYWLLQSGHHRLAADALRGALRCAPGDDHLYSALIECRLRQGDRAGAERLRRERDAVSA